MKVRVKTKSKLLIPKRGQALTQLRQMRGLFIDKGVKNVIAWQRRVRKDRKKS